MFYSPLPTPFAARPIDLDLFARPETPERASADAELRRPATMVRAAQAGAALYRREKHLRGALPGFAGSRRSAREIAERLAAQEAQCEEMRRAHLPEYSPRRHVLLLSALLAERSAMKAEEARKAA